VTGYLNPQAGSVLRAVVVAAVLVGAFWVIASLAPRAMGRGDVKLVPSLGLLTGFVSIPTTVLSTGIAFVLGALVAIAGLLSRRLTLTSAIPFGPCLLAGCWLVLAVPALTTWIVG
jgi:leader peptidase (prepilin peptidase)/N-methyltransferase